MCASTFTIKQNFDFAHKPLDPGNVQANPICVIGVFIEVDVEPIGNDEQSVDFLVTGFVGEAPTIGTGGFHVFNTESGDGTGIIYGAQSDTASQAQAVVADLQVADILVS